MVSSRYLRYLIAVPCILALFIIISISSNAQAESSPDYVAVEVDSFEPIPVPPIEPIAINEEPSETDNSGLDVNSVNDISGLGLISFESRADQMVESIDFDRAVIGLSAEDRSFGGVLDGGNAFSFDWVLSDVSDSRFDDPILDVNGNLDKNLGNLVDLDYDTIRENNDERTIDTNEQYPPSWTDNRETMVTLTTITEKMLDTRLWDIPAENTFDSEIRQARMGYEDSRVGNSGLGFDTQHNTINGEGKGPPVNNEIKIFPVDAGPKLVLPMFSRIANPMANGSIRGEIIEYIRANPGEHLSKIKRRLNLSTSSIVHHLRVLERTDLILAHKDGKYKRYFVNENGYRSSINGEYKSIFSVLKNKNSRLIASFLVSNPHSTLSDVSKTMNLNPSTVHWHADRLETVRILQKVKDGKCVRYFIRDEGIVNRVIALLDT